MTECFVALFNAHERQLRNYVSKLVRSAPDADDVFQEASMIMLKKFDLSIPETKFGHWACRVIRFKVMEYRRRRSRDRHRFVGPALDYLTAPNGEPSGDSLVAFVKLQQCLKRLTVTSRQIFCARYQFGDDVEAIAARHGRSVQAVHRLLSRAKSTVQVCSQSTSAIQKKQRNAPNAKPVYSVPLHNPLCFDNDSLNFRLKTDLLP